MDECLPSMGGFLPNKSEEIMYSSTVIVVYLKYPSCAWSFVEKVAEGECHYQFKKKEEKKTRKETMSERVYCRVAYLKQRG